MAAQPSDTVSEAVGELRIPPEFAKYEDNAEAEVIVSLEQWKQKASSVLSVLRDSLHARQATGPADRARIVYATSSFDGEGAWIVDSSREIARDILSSLGPPSEDLLQQILRDFVKPAFIANPHPKINIETGRKLPRPAGGPLGHLDYLEAQEWKSRPEMFNVISWCLVHTEGRTIERLWHLFIPPIMTYLDDHQAAYRLQGVRLVSLLLERAPADLLRRTGVDVLLTNSLKTCLTFLHNPETPDLIRATASTYIRLSKTTTTEGSAARFDQLCSLLADSIIGNIWVYASRELNALHAVLQVLPEVIDILGVGTSRYLKALIPQLVFPLIPAPENDSSDAYKLSSIRALKRVVHACKPRIHKWRGPILEGVLKCWVDLAGRGGVDEDTPALKDELRDLCVDIIAACQPSTPDIEEELKGVRALNPDLFDPLLNPSPNTLSVSREGEV